MSPETRDYIDRLTKKVMSVYNVPTPIEDMVPIIEALGGTVEERVHIDHWEGTVKKTGDNSFAIAVESGWSIKQMNYVLACELGHVLLHMGFKTNLDCWEGQEIGVYKRFGNGNQLEQVLEFGLSLLMPKEIFREVVRDLSLNGLLNIDNVIDYFKVAKSLPVLWGRMIGAISMEG